MHFFILTPLALDTFALFGSAALMQESGITLDDDGTYIGWNGQPGVPVAKRWLEGNETAFEV